MFILLMRVRLQSAANTVRASLQNKPLFSACLCAAGVLISVGLFLAFHFILSIARSIGLLDAAVHQMLQYLFLFLIGGAVPFVAGTLIQSRDCILLLTSPASVRTITAAKLIDATIANSLQFSALGFPALAACAAICRFNALQWLAFPLVLAVFTFLPALITALALLALLRLFGPTRITLIVNILNVCTGAIVCLSVLSRLSPSAAHTSDLGSIAANQIKSFTAGSTSSSFTTPAALISRAFQSASYGSTTGFLGWMLAVTALTMLLFAICVALGEKAIPAAAAAEFGGQKEQQHGTDLSLAASPVWLPVSAACGAVIRKDLQMLKRDSVLISQTAMPIILFAVPFLLVTSDRSMQELLAPLCFSMITIILFMQTSILSMSSIGMEGQAYWACKAAPVSATLVLKAKWLWSTLISAGISGVLALFTAAATGLSPAITAAVLAGILLVSASLCGIGTGISAAFPKFVYDNPALRVSAWALILGFMASSAYVLTVGLVAGLAAWGSTMLAAADAAAMHISLPAVVAITACFILAISAAAIFVPLYLGARKLNNSAWEH